ncbi:MAG: TonB-dependent receptor [Bradyrhizobium sp.]|nr:TonB-dependent receptor [Bradyrhizobium sp.]
MGKLMIGRRSVRMLALAGAATFSLMSVPAFAQDRTYDIAPTSLSHALREFGQISGKQIIFTEDLVRGKRSPQVKGSFSPDEALQRLLSQSGLRTETTPSGAIMVMRSQAVAGQVTAPKASPSAGEAVAGSAAADSESTGEIVVTGSRINVRSGSTPHDLKVYDSKQLAQSGQGTVSDFLNTIPSVSLSTTEFGYGAPGGGTTVRLHGLTIGTTLVLINGRRVQTSGPQALTGSDFFDLNNIPTAAVDRIEVLADGSSAIYGSDAIAGVVNIILRSHLNGFSVEAQYGGASGTHETKTSVAWGKTWDNASISIIGSFQTRTGLTTSERALTSDNNYTRYGGPDNNLPACNPGNVFSVDGSPLPGAPAGSGATYAAITSAAPAGGKPSLGSFAYGQLNQCSIIANASVIPATRRFGVFAQASYNLTPSIELFAEFMFSNVRQDTLGGNQTLYGQPGFQSFTVSAQNPFNPFGRQVGISSALTGIAIEPIYRTNFIRPLLGARGSMGRGWRWELSAVGSADYTRQPTSNVVTNYGAIQSALDSSNPNVALNPFINGPAIPAARAAEFFSEGLSTFTGSNITVNGFVEGPLVRLPAGDLHVVLGAEFDRSKLSFDQIINPYGPNDTQAAFQRNSYAIFGEARVPVFGPQHSSGGGDLLDVSLAGRYDHYSDFGEKVTPEIGVEMRPTGSLLFRGTYSRSFKAPPLPNLYGPRVISANNQVTDPLTGLPVITDVITGGNPNLRPETGNSQTVGVVYNSPMISGLRLSATWWRIEVGQAIQNVATQFVLDNALQFPGRVVRGQNGDIVQVDDTSLNFGSIDVQGIDYSASYSFHTSFGAITTSLDATQTYRYRSRLVPGAPFVSGASRAQDSLNWSPKLKLVAAASWTLGGYAVHVDGRYTGQYRDYDLPRTIGNFWLIDTNVRLPLGQALLPSSKVLGKSYLEVGAVNLFNRLPQFSSFAGSALGYDITQGDLRGRWLYARVGLNF